MYAVHTTPGFIIESRPSGEAGRVLSVFTRDMGLIRAVAQGIRLEKSKLRYHAQEYFFGEFSFVRGKEYWRLTNARRDTNGANKASELIARIALLLRRLLHGEEAHVELFGHIEAAVELLGSGRAMTPDELQTLESVLVFRIVKALGYVGVDQELDGGVVDGPLSIELIRASAGKRALLNKHINKALRESQL